MAVKAINSEKDIEKLLESGWVFSIVHKDDEEYFNDAFFRHIEKDEIFRYGNGWFVKKSEKLFNGLVSIGMPNFRKDPLQVESQELLSYQAS